MTEPDPAALKQTARDWIDDNEDDLVAFEQEIWDYHETAWREYRSARAYVDLLRDRGFDVQVAMVTAVDPDFDIVEMGFDAYVTKPPTRETLLETITDLLERRERTDRVREYRALLSKRAALEGGKSGTELVESDAYAELEERIAAIERDLETDEDRLLDDSEFVGALRNFEESDR